MCEGKSRTRRNGARGLGRMERTAAPFSLPVAFMSNGHPGGKSVRRPPTTPPRLPGLDICSPDHFAPLFGFGGDQLSEIGRGARESDVTQII
jgi:hypothetical protein